MKLRILGILAVVVCFGVSAHASSLTLTTAQLDAFTGSGGTNVLSQTEVAIGDGVQFTSTATTSVGPPNVPNMMTSNFTSSVLSIATTSTDTFSVNYFNSNANPWHWEMILNYSGGGTSISNIVNPGSGLSGVLTAAALTGTITSITIMQGPDQFTAATGVGGFADATANGVFTSAPEPTSVLLVALGLVGIPVLKRKLGR